MKLKAKIYQYTGLFLAHKEQLEYLESDEFWKAFDEALPFNWQNELENRDLHGLLIGSWQAKHGFYRRISRRFKYGSVLAWIDIFVTQFIDDVKIFLQKKLK